MSILPNASSKEEVPLPELQDKFLQIETVLNTELVERELEIRAMLQAVIAKQHIFLLGEPGIAKSYLINRFGQYLDGAKHFDILLTRFTAPEEVIGPYSLPALKEGRFVRVTDGYLPTADIAFIDEIFKANSAILNSLLQAINERVYRHGTQTIDIPLSTVFCASNELPQDESLNALYDRLLIRLEVKDVQDSSAFMKMLTTRPDPKPEKILTWEEVVFAQEEAKTTNIPDVVIQALTDIRERLHDVNIRPTPRRFQQALSIVRAAAWLDGELEADTEHLMPLQHVLWDDPEQRHQVADIIAKAANPLEAEALSLLDEVLTLRKTCENLEAGIKNGDFPPIQAKQAAIREFDVAQRFYEAFKDLNARSKRRRRLSEPMLRCRKQLLWMHEYFAEALGATIDGNVKPDEYE